jgi:formate hydrogenlyase subunit 4
LAISIGSIVTLVVGLIVISVLLPVGLQNLANMNTTGLDSNVVTLLSLIGIFVAISILIAFVPRFRKGDG